MISGLFFSTWRVFEILTLIPVIGMLSYFVHGYVVTNALTPNYILILFIVSILACAWAIHTLFQHSRTHHNAHFVAFIDLCFVGGFIASAYYLRFIAHQNCAYIDKTQTVGFYADLGLFGQWGASQNLPWAVHVEKSCAMLKACFVFAIMNCVFFFVTALFANMMHEKETVVVRRETHTRRHSGRRRSGHRGSRAQYYV